MNIARFDSLVTELVSGRIRLADDCALTVKGPGVDTVDEVFLFPGLAAPDTEEWAREDSVELFLTGNTDAGRMFLDVPVWAVRDLIEQHGGEHEDQEGGPGAVDGGETAEVIAVRALAVWGITADRYCEAGGDTWLDISRDQGTAGIPFKAGEARKDCVVLYLFDEVGGKATISRPPAQGDHWHVVVFHDTGEHTLMTRPVDQIDECAAAVADWLTTPRT
ncbi:hypothetical protein CTZ27_35845 [Streptomyces griseocarneus]|nr:hypothetical protein CTZ27_35845 [Streptomyces griseocarneus]